MTQSLKKVGLYRLTHRIGSGATSEVFEAVKQGDHQKYAIKMIRLNKITQGQKQMITKEISIIKSISHPNIVKLYDNLQTTNNFYLVFQFCEKGDLEKYLREFYGPLIPEDAVQKIFFCIGDAVREIHSKGIVHRDIKLANILLKRDLVIKLADFGFAKEINEQQFMLKTYCGTPITMAPQILQNKLYDRKCDIWSLGVILFQLIYGKLPFSIADGYNKFVQRVVKQPLKIPALPQMPQQFKDLLNKCLQKNPINRYSIQDLMHNEWILQGKNKKLEQRKKQVDLQVTTILTRISPQNEQSDIEDMQRQRNQIIQINTAQKLYKLIKNQLQKIVQSHIDIRQQIYSKIKKAKVSNQLSQASRSEYKNLERLFFYLDFKYLSFLKDSEIVVTKDTQEIKIKIHHINSLQFPDFMYVKKSHEQEHNQPQNVALGDTIQNFLRNQANQDSPPDTLEKRKQRYLLVDKFFSMLRIFDLSVDIIFSHHFRSHKISLQNVLKEFKQMGKHVSESMIQDSSEINTKSEINQNQQKGTSQIQEKRYLYDRDSNFITLSIECKERNEKLKEYRQNLKLTGQRMVDQISKTMQGYYS